SDGVQSQASYHFSQIVADDEVVLDDQDAWGRSAHSPGPLTTLLHTPRQSSKCARPLLSSDRIHPRQENRPTPKRARRPSVCSQFSPRAVARTKTTPSTARSRVTSPSSTAFSQIVSRGHDVRYASITS